MAIHAPSLANIELFSLDRETRALYSAGIRFFHLDIMDGNYVDNLCFPIQIVRAVKQRYPDATAEVHLMVLNPEKYIVPLREQGADWVSFHLDATRFSRRLLNLIRENGMQAGVAINPSQPVSLIEPLLAHLDYVVLMAVEPGYTGQQFLDGSTERLAALASYREKKGMTFQIVVDGGVDYVNGPQVIENGADVIVGNRYTVFEQPAGLRRRVKDLTVNWGQYVRNTENKNI